MHLNVVNKPLNTVLNMLGLEVSFDDKALSRYQVTLSKTFENPEKALQYLLMGKPFRIKRKEQVYIVIPIKDYMRRGRKIFPSDENQQQYVFSGTVSDSQTQERLGYATVHLLGSDNKLLGIGITDENGIFNITTLRYPQKIKISYIGYHTTAKDISRPDKGKSLGTFSLQTETISLNETIVANDNVRHKLDRENYVVTPEMTDGMTNAEELLDKIPGIYFDRFSKLIKVNNSKDILLLVDGVRQSENYIRNLSPQRIQSVEIVREPSGRFVSDGYSAIVNLKLKKDYAGYDMYVSLPYGYYLSKKMGDGWSAFSKPSFGINYTHKDYSFFANYSRNDEKRYFPVYKKLTYNGVLLESKNLADTNPNSTSDAKNGTFSFGLNLNVAPGHTIGFQADFISDKINSSQIYSLQRTDVATLQQRSTKDSTNDNTSADTFVGTAFYQGKWGSRLQLYGDFSYNHYSNDIQNEYNLTDIQHYVSGNDYNEYKNHTLLNIEGQYVLSAKASFNLGYSNSWRKYASNSSQGVGFLDYREYRNKYFGYVSVYPSRDVQFKVGTAIENVNFYNRDAKTNYRRVLPYAQLNCNFGKAVNLNASYSTNQYYPALYQLSPMSFVIDNYLSQVGNPGLKSALIHTAALRLSLWNKLTINPIVNYTKDNITESYIEKEYKLYRTFYNLDTKEFRIQTTFDQPVGKYFKWSNLVTFYRNGASGAEYHSNPNGLLIDSKISYYNPEKSFGVELGYHRNMKKQIISQGYRMFDKDNWQIGISKELWKKRIAVSCSYIPPISLGVQYDQLRVLNSSLYNERTSLNLKSYNNMLLLKLSFRFNHDRNKPVERKSKIMKDEREKQTLEF